MNHRRVLQRRLVAAILVLLSLALLTLYFREADRGFARGATGEGKFEVRETLCGSALDVATSPRAAAQAYNDCEMQDRVCGAVAASVQPMSPRSSARSGDRDDTAEACEGGLGAQALGVVAGGHQQLASMLDANHTQATGAWLKRWRRVDDVHAGHVA